VSDILKPPSAELRQLTERLRANRRETRAMNCKSCETRRRRGLPGMCPACASERTRLHAAPPPGERARIVAYLRARSSGASHFVHLDTLADDIENGAHLAPTTKGAAG